MLWLWHRPAAVAPIRPLAWEPPYATGEVLKKKKKWTTVKGLFLEPSVLFSKPQDKDRVMAVTSAVIEASRDHCPH